MKLEALLKESGLNYEIKNGDSIDVGAIAYDSRKVKKGDLFFALKGQNFDGTRFIADAIGKGAAAIVTEEGTECGGGVPHVLVKDAKLALASVSAAFYKRPSERLNLSGVTGTNGKTTVTYIMESILNSAGKTPGVIGTVNYRYKGKTIEAPHTTPLSPELQSLFSDMAASGVTHCVMEVSSHAVEEKRVAASAFKVRMFTNLTPEHLDYHGTMEKYFEAKAAFFTSSEFGGGASVINVDDEWGGKLRGMVAKGWGYSLKDKNAEIHPESYEVSSNGIRAILKTPKSVIKIESELTAEHNLYNIMCAVGGALALGIDKEHIEEGIRNLKNVPGRLERVMPESGIFAYVDYAHTPDALERTLKTMRALTDERGGRLITVFGCGGDRDRVKRPLMGEISTTISDLTIVTSDNPRSEDPLFIINDIKRGIRGIKKFGDLKSLTECGYLVEADRATAIEKAVSLAKENDTVLVAGKGHEDYQIVNGEKTHFDDKEQLERAFLKVKAS